MSAGDGPRILIIKLSSLGDLLFSFPAVRWLKEAYPGSKITWAVEKPHARLLALAPYVDKIISVSSPVKGRGTFRDMLVSYKKIKKEKYDIAIDFQGLLKSGIVSFLSGAPVRVALGGKFSREGNSFFQTHTVEPPSGDFHVVYRYFYLARKAAEYLAGRTVRKARGPSETGKLSSEKEIFSFMRGPFLHVPESWKDEARKVLEEIHVSEKYAILNVGGGWPNKRWSPVRFGILGRMLAGKGWKVLVAWGPGEKEAAEQTVRHGKEGVILLPECSIGGLAAISQKAGLFIGGDTGPTHVAAMLGVPTVGLYGPSSFRTNAPFGPEVAVVASRAGCAPCWKRVCAKKTVSCMEMLEPVEVFRAALSLLQA